MFQLSFYTLFRWWCRSFFIHFTQTKTWEMIQFDLRIFLKRVVQAPFVWLGVSENLHRTIYLETSRSSSQNAKKVISSSTQTNKYPSWNFSWFYMEQRLSSPRGICFPKSRIPKLAWFKGSYWYAAPILSWLLDLVSSRGRGENWGVLSIH